MSATGDGIVVDDDDNVIANKFWPEVIPTDRVRISAVFIENSKGEVLIAQRSHHKRHQPNLWGPSASGTVEPGESYEQNAYKELEEEVGLSGITLREVKKLKWDGSPTDKRYCVCYRGVCDWPIKKFTLQESEVDAVAWISIPDLLKELKEQPDKYLPNTETWLRHFGLIS